MAKIIFYLTGKNRFFYLLKVFNFDTQKQYNMKISELKLNPNNPRLIRDEKFKKLVKSIQDFPQMMELRPIIVDENNVIQGGNMRYQALKALNYKELPETWVKQGKDLTPEQWREFVIKDNVGFGEWDFEQLANEWDTEQLSDWGLDLPVWESQDKVFDEKEINDEIETERKCPKCGFEF